MQCVLNTLREVIRQYEAVITNVSLPGEGRFCTQDYVSECVYETRCPDLVMQSEYSVCCTGEDCSVSRAFAVPGVQ